MRQSLTQRKLVSLFAAIVLAFSMLGVAPMAAFATADSAGSGELSAAEIGTPDRSASTITATNTAANVAVGSTITMTVAAGHFSAPGLDTSSQHIDYKITGTADGGAATINKHSGVLTATSAGEVTVTAYLIDAPQQSGINTNPCDDEYLDSDTKTVTINTSTAYGYQGTGFQIYVSSPTVGSASINASGDTYTNLVSGNKTAGSTVEFIVYQNAGLNQYSNGYNSWMGSYSSPEAAYKALAGQYITYTDATGVTTTLSSATNGFTVTELNSSSGYVKIAVPVGSLITGASSGTGTLHFGSGLHTFKNNNVTLTNKTLGVNVNFDITIASANS